MMSEVREDRCVCDGSCLLKQQVSSVVGWVSTGSHWQAHFLRTLVSGLVQQLNTELGRVEQIKK